MKGIDGSLDGKVKPRRPDRGDKPAGISMTPYDDAPCPSTHAHGIGVYHCRVLGPHNQHEAGDLRW